MSNRTFTMFVLLVQFATVDMSKVCVCHSPSMLRLSTLVEYHVLFANQNNWKALSLPLIHLYRNLTRV